MNGPSRGEELGLGIKYDKSTVDAGLFKLKDPAKLTSTRDNVGIVRSLSLDQDLQQAG